MRKAYEILTAAALSLASAGAAATPTVCAATQAYSAIEPLKSERDFKTVYGTSEDLEAKITNGEAACDLVVSSDEKLPVVLIRSGLGDRQSLHAIARAPLVLWSADPSLLDASALAVSQRRLKSLALPKAELTPAGYAASRIVSRSDFPTEYLKGRIYRTEQEFQVLAMVESGNVQAGFLTRPLVLGPDGAPKGSYWQVPRANYPEIDYYLMLLNRAKRDPGASDLYSFFKGDPKVLKSFQRAGFDATLK
ncbi:MAG: molybdate ABC transporter substrate-binding protein [Succinivibrio sp.]